MKNYINTTIVAIVILIGVFLITNTFENRNQYKDKIIVTGLGKKDFKSDLIVWKGSFSKKATELKEAYKRLKEDKTQILNYLSSKGIKSSDVLFEAVNITKDYEYPYDKEGNQLTIFTGYILSQEIKIESKEIEKVEAVSRDITDLINDGVEFTSYVPEYFYTKLSELKIEMIASATEDARIRAQKMAENANAEVGDLKSAQMGIFQIIGQNSSEDYSWGGTFNTSSKMKTATITVKLEFGID